MSLAALTSGILVTGVGAPPGLGTLRSLRSADPDLVLVAADTNPLAGGLFEPGTQSQTLPSAAADPEAYRKTVRAVCEARGLDIIIPGSEAEVAALAPVAPPQNLVMCGAITDISPRFAEVTGRSGSSEDQHRSSPLCVIGMMNGFGVWST